MKAFYDFVAQFRVNYINRQSKSAFFLRSTLVVDVLDLLYRAGYISGFRFVNQERREKAASIKTTEMTDYRRKNKLLKMKGFFSVEVFFKYHEGRPLINEIGLVKEGYGPKYMSRKEILKHYPLSKFTIITTSSGLMSNMDLFFLKNVGGGRILFYLN